MSQSSSYPTVVLVHGAFADASGFAGIIRELQTAGVEVQAPPVPLRGVAFDADTVAAHVAAIDGPVVLVGHSYGGAVITQASDHLDNVVGLVYLAAFGLDVGESADSSQAVPGPSLLANNARVTPYDALGAASGPDLFIDPAKFRETFCADVPAELAAVMAASQRPIATTALSEKCTSAGWKSKPTSYLISAQDRTINPDSQRFMAGRMGGRIETIDASHCALISRPVETAAFHPRRSEVDRRTDCAQSTVCSQTRVNLELKEAKCQMNCCSRPT
jgi:pimeloyl-ACP methyl ester carboxylesterase